LELEDLGWTPAWAEKLHASTQDGRPARVSAVHKNAYVVMDGAGERPAIVSGHLRHHAEGLWPTIGDWVVLANDGEPAVIAAVLPRSTCLERKAAGRTSHAQPLAANVDAILVVMGLDGDFNRRRLERTLVMIEPSGASPIVLLNKCDLATDAEERRREIEAVAPGVAIHLVSALRGDGLGALTPALACGRTLVLLGSSGAGKSTLVNRLLGTDEQSTREVRAHDDRGRHTTTARQLFRLASGALLIDTPGIREIQLLGGADAADGVFADIAALASQCRFRDCRHDGEPGCAVRQAIDDGTLEGERLESLHKLNAEMRYQAEREDKLLALQKKAQWKAIHKAQRRNRDKE
jgi:ribosome biogenesis GTPase